MMKHIKDTVKLVSLLGAVGCIGSATYFGGVAAVHRFRQHHVEKKLIQWSSDGKHFLGPLGNDDYRLISFNSYTSPDGKTTIDIDHEGCCVIIAEKDASVSSRKYLHRDGNTSYYVEWAGGQVIYSKEWDVNGDEIVRRYGPGRLSINNMNFY